MSFSNEICGLVVSNLDLLEEAPLVIEQVQKKVFESVNEQLESALKGKPGWTEGAVFDFVGDGDSDQETTFAPENWPRDEDGSFFAWYSLESVGEDPIYPLTALLGKSGTAYFGITFGANAKHFSKKGKQLEKFLANHKNRPALRELGVAYDEEAALFVVPIRLDPDAVTEEFPRLSTCLKPVDDALEVVLKAHPYFDQMIADVTDQPMA